MAEWQVPVLMLEQASQLAMELESAWQLEMVWGMVSGWPPELEAPALMLGEPREWPWAGVQGLPPAWALESTRLEEWRWVEEVA